MLHYQELGYDPVGDVANFSAEPGLGMKCTVQDVEAFAKQNTRPHGDGYSAIITRYIIMDTSVQQGTNWYILCACGVF